MRKSDEKRREPLIDRYYGLMLGFFLGFCGLEVPADLYAGHRSRIREVMEELEVEVDIPAAHDQLVEQFASIARKTITGLKACSAQLADFFAFGFHSLHLLAGTEERDGVPAAVIRKDFHEIIADHGLDRAAIRKLLEPGWDSDRVDDPLWSEFVGRYYRLAQVAIWPLAKQPGVAFVIMPFSDPFRDYYLSFYREILRRAGYASIRAWVGVTNESYLRLLATLISRCGVALADVSAQPATSSPNLNVIHEIGLNMGLENATFLIRDARDVVLPSNFTGLPILQYEADAPEFPAAIAAAIAAHLEQGPQQVPRSRPKASLSGHATRPRRSRNR